MPTTATKPDQRTAELLKQHRELVAQYPVTTGAAKAQVSRKLNIVQMELDLIGAEYEYWTRPECVVTRSYVFTADELVARIQGLRRQLTRDDRSEASKSTAERELQARLAEAEKREISIPEPVAA